MAEYSIINVGADKRLNVVGDDVVSLSNNFGLSLWSKSGTMEQKWIVDSLGNGVYIKSKINPNYGLKAVYDGNDYSCSLYDSETYSAVNIIPVGARYRIQLASDPQYYLTAAGSGNGASVYWTKLIDGSAYQTWHFHLWPESVTLSGVQNLNQKYYQNDQVIKDYGCCVCCCCDVASYYRGDAITLDELKNREVYSESSAYCNWTNIPDANYVYGPSGKAQAIYLNDIRTDIANEMPVIVQMFVNEVHQHYVVAYGYTNNGATLNDILVYDPNNSNSYSPTGLTTTLAESLRINNHSGIYRLLFTSPK